MKKHFILSLLFTVLLVFASCESKVASIEEPQTGIEILSVQSESGVSVVGAVGDTVRGDNQPILVKFKARPNTIVVALGLHASAAYTGGDGVGYVELNSIERGDRLTELDFHVFNGVVFEKKGKVPLGFTILWE